MHLDTKALDEVLKAMEAQYKGASVAEAGIIEGGEIADNDRRTDRTFQEIAEYAYYNEYGHGVPERPFMRNAFNARNEQWKKDVIENLRAHQPMFLALMNAGKVMRDDIRASIDGAFGGYEPNSKAWRDAKATPEILGDEIVGVHYEDPLKWTGAMYRSIGYKLLTADEAANDELITS